MSTTTIIAIYGAILSTLVLIWNIFKHYLDRGRMQVSCMLGRVIGIGVNDPNLYLAYTVTNIGTKPITITHAGGKNKDGSQFIINATEIPRKLDPSEYVIIKTDDIKNLGQLKSLFVINSHGEYCNITKSNLKSIIKDLKQ